MNGVALLEKYGYLAKELAKLNLGNDTIDAFNVFQEANPACRRIVYQIIEENILAGSCLGGTEHFVDFFSQVKCGKRGLILMEHDSTVDLPLLCYLLDRDLSSVESQLSDRIAAVAGMKLNEESPVIKAWAEGFSRIVIYPSRSLAAISDPELLERETARSRSINTAAMRALDTARKQGRVVLVHPSGTRYRPGKPETRRAVREIDSYLRMFDIMILVSVNGCIVRITPEDPDNMLADRVVADKILVASSPVMECDSYRKSVMGRPAGSDVDTKQAVADRLMELLLEQHDTYEAIRCPSGHIGKAAP
ncbi:MAG: 1-acyl-sn-glycerol-3-phosphate acyltransferase [Spirochaetaceae bacterium]|jgi:glycerol-3-phosphate O-acyltransferase|nr:1-acyl-sn-glycerol-3-phosphate acyltransferase [Spirochaetaceae bacterium]